MKELRRLLSKNPEIALGVAVFAGLALGAGWVPMPSLGSLIPTGSGPAEPEPAAAGQVPTAAPAVAPSASMWD